MDFALILVVATAAAGAIWALDALVFARARHAAGGRDPIVVEYARSFFPVLLIVLLLRSFLFEPFRIPSESMVPTLLEGDFIFVNKFSYGLRLPVLNAKIVDTGNVERGDVVVFRLPTDPSINYIKRVVGLPGDVIEYPAGERQLTINGETVPIEVVGRFPEDPKFDLVREDLGTKEHEVLWSRAGRGRGGRYEVPEGHYFMMGDNRDNSQDSRYKELVGLVPEENLVGRAELIWMNWRWFGEGGPRWSRIGNSID